jgi:protein TonB
MYVLPETPVHWTSSSSWPADDVVAAAGGQQEKPPVDMQAVDVEPKVIQRGTVVYPKEAAKAGQEGTVWVKVWVTAKGEPKEVEVLKSENQVLNKAALDAARGYRFTPAEIKGKPVAVWITIPFKFKLADKKAPPTQ